MLAPYDIAVPLGPTRLEPTQTSNFGAYNIATKITKGRIEIVWAGDPLVRKGEPFNGPRVHLFHNLGVQPIQFGMDIRTVYLEGSMLEDTTFHSLEGLIKRAAFNIAAISQEVGLYTFPLVPFSLRKGLHNLLTIHRTINQIPETLEEINNSLNLKSLFE